MMTLDEALAHARLKELHALTRARRALAAGTSPDWLYALSAIDARVSELRHQLAHVDPLVLRTADAELDDEPPTAARVSKKEDPLPFCRSVADMPPGRIH
jgi:hypothetical protein